MSHAGIVYIVMHDDYDNTWPADVFSTEAAADAYAKRRNDAAPKGCDDWSVWAWTVREDDGSADP